MTKSTKESPFDALPEDTFFDEESKVLDAMAGLFEEEYTTQNEPEQAAEDTKENKPEELVVGGVKCPYTEAELLPIFDSLMFQDEYVERIEVVPNRLWMTFRSRTAEENNGILVMIDKRQFTSIVTLSNHQALLTLAHAVVAFSATDKTGKALEMDLSKQTSKERYELLSSKPSAIIEAASNALAKFDEKMGWALRMGLKSF